MPRGGHGRSGPAAFDASARELHGTRTRARHREKGAAGAPLLVVDPPRHLTASQRSLWRYYAPNLAAEGRLHAKGRDALAKYVISLDMAARINRRLRRDQLMSSNGAKHPLLSELRGWLTVSRLYESDLLLNPASSVPAPLPPVVDVDDDERELDAIVN